MSRFHAAAAAAMIFAPCAPLTLPRTLMLPRAALRYVIDASAMSRLLPSSLCYADAACHDSFRHTVYVAVSITLLLPPLFFTLCRVDFRRRLPPCHARFSTPPDADMPYTPLPVYFAAADADDGYAHMLLDAAVMLMMMPCAAVAALLPSHAMMIITRHRR